MAAARVLVVFANAAERQAARVLEDPRPDFAVGHLDRPEVLLAAAAKIKPDLVIFYYHDEHLATEWCARLRKESPYGGLIVFMFPADTPGNGRKAIEAGADGILSADLAPEELAARILSLMRAGRVQAENFRRARAAARASAEAADMIVRLEEANRKIKAQNAQISAQQASIEEQLALINHEVGVATKLQVSLLPDAQKIVAGKGIFLQDYYLPATNLGGDYYDYLPRGEEIFICVADVTGHGIASALVGAQMRALARTDLLANVEMEPMFAQLNQFMYSTFKVAYLMTMAALLYAPATGAVRLINAGHCPLIHYVAAAKKCVEYELPCLPLGVRRHGPFTTKNFTLAAGDALLLYSDGITEATNDAKEEFGAARLAAALQTALETAEPNIPAYLMRQVKEFCGGDNFDDDITLVVTGRV
ncbi:MAG: SpoIIE family protein phosphatase [Planctomycetota bacterium]|jgi:sigma-B regulation protein RsbU (phosphoserine phosphatase)|nr:SpoIIE family protein phosphatase [Planctomycetota bacterium]